MSVPTKTTCRIGSDVDLLSRVQLEEVLALLDSSSEKPPFEVAAILDPSFLEDSRAQPGTPARIALLLNALLGGELDALVIDAVNLPTHIPSGLTFGAITQRITPYDALISNGDLILDELPDGAVVVATGAKELETEEYLRGQDPRVVTLRELEAALDYAHSTIRYAKDADTLQITGAIEAELLKHRTHLAGYMVTEEHLADLHRRISHFNEAMKTKGGVKSGRVANFQKLGRLFRETDDLLLRKMDRLMFRLSTYHPDFYTAYHSARKIIDR